MRRSRLQVPSWGRASPSSSSRREAPLRPSVPAAGASGQDSPFAEALPAPNFERLLAVRRWQERPEVRRRWLFADEATCLAWFGAPDLVDRESEMWSNHQALPDDDGDGHSEIRERATLSFQRGWLIRIDVSAAQ